MRDIEMTKIEPWEAETVQELKDSLCTIRYTIGCLWWKKRCQDLVVGQCVTWRWHTNGYEIPNLDARLQLCAEFERLQYLAKKGEKE